MERLARRSWVRKSWTPGRSAWRGLAWFAGGLATVAAALVGAFMAVFFAATLVVIAVLASALLALAAAALKARRTVRAPVDAGLIEARHVGGHSWVAYGWDGRR
jgi:hypothetical protein